MQELVYKEGISHIIKSFNLLTFPKKEWVPFNLHYSSVISGAFSSRNQNIPNTDGSQPVCILSSALAKRCLPLCDCKVATLEYLKRFGCSPRAMQHHHLVTNPQKRSLLFWFDLLLQQASLLHGLRCHNMCAAHEPPHHGLWWGGGESNNAAAKGHA